jgi:hypothetical protein
MFTLNERDFLTECMQMCFNEGGPYETVMKKKEFLILLAKLGISPADINDHCETLEDKL